METPALGALALPLLPIIIVYIVGFFLALTRLKHYANACRNAAIGFVLLFLSILTQIGMRGFMINDRQSGLSLAEITQRAAAFSLGERLLAVVGMIFLLLAILADRRDPGPAH
jgi:uncharacterized membrane protein YecN with MAPEG domain